MIKFFVKRHFVLYMICLCLAACAVQGPPGGGPVDNIPPSIISVEPADSSTGINFDSEISFEFSEGMAKQTVETSFFISPMPETDPQFKWKKNRLRVTYGEPLKADQTYVISIGTSAQDMRKNKLESTYTWAFSTGDSLDSGVIRGRVYNVNEPSGLLVWAYLLDGDPEPDPLKKRGDYITQTGDDGSYTLPYIRQGTYRVFMIEDGDKDHAFNVRADRIAFPSGDVGAGNMFNAPFLRFQPVTYDTLAPRLLMIEAPSQQNVRLLFEEEVAPETVTPENFTVFDFSTGDEIGDAVQYSYRSSEQGNDVSLFMTGLDAGREYQVRVDGLKDMPGNVLRDFRDSTTVFTASALPDTAAFTIISVVPEDSSEAVAPYSSVFVRFNSPVLAGGLEGHFTLSDSAGTAVDGTISQVSPLYFSFTPSEPLGSLARYTIQFAPDSIRNLAGNTLNVEKDSYVFSTRNRRRTGDLYGLVSIAGGESDAPVVIMVQTESGDGDSHTITLDKPGSFTIAGLSPGNYRLFGYLDTDRNGRWSPGSIRPFVPAEPFDAIEGDIAIRAGIDNRLTTGLILQLYERD